MEQKMKNIIKKLAGLSFLLLLGTVNVYAAFLQNVPQKLMQPNGITVKCFASGD